MRALLKTQLRKTDAEAARKGALPQCASCLSYRGDTPKHRKDRCFRMNLVLPGRKSETPARCQVPRSEFSWGSEAMSIDMGSIPS